MSVRNVECGSCGGDTPVDTRRLLGFHRCCWCGDGVSLPLYRKEDGSLRLDYPKWIELLEPGDPVIVTSVRTMPDGRQFAGLVHHTTVRRMDVDYIFLADSPADKVLRSDGTSTEDGVFYRIVPAWPTEPSDV